MVPAALLGRVCVPVLAFLTRLIVRFISKHIPTGAHPRRWQGVSEGPWGDVVHPSSLALSNEGFDWSRLSRLQTKARLEIPADFSTGL